MMRTEIRLITPQLAKTYLERNRNNRPLRQHTVNYYASQMVRNLWKLTGQGVSFASNGNIVDGQHRLSAIVKSKKSIKMLLIFDVQEDTFDVYDTGKNRSVSDVFAIEGIKNTTAIASSMLKYFVLKKDLEIGNNTNKKHLNLVTKDFVQKYYENPKRWEITFKLASLCYTKIRLLKKTEIISFAFYLINDKKHKIELVESFFKELFHIKISTNKTIDLFRDLIVKDALSTKKMTTRHKLMLLKKTWNYYLIGKEVQVLTFNPKKDNKIVIL